MYKLIFCLFALIFLLSSCANLNKNFCAMKFSPIDRSQHHQFLSNNEEQGYASWYGAKFNRKRTYSGERYNMYKLTAAHRTLPISTRVLVTNLNNDRQVIVRVNDRGPFVENRLIDLSYAAAKKLRMIGHGVVPVKVKIIPA